MTTIWLILAACMVWACVVEARREKREFIKRAGMSRKNIIKAYKHMRGDNGKVTYQELLKNMNNN